MILIKLKCVSCLFSKKTLSNAVTIMDGMALCEACCREHLNEVRKIRKKLEQKKAEVAKGVTIAPPSKSEPPIPELKIEQIADKKSIKTLEDIKKTEEISKRAFKSTKGEKRTD